jgi:hypothetical protein
MAVLVKRAATKTTSATVCHPALPYEVYRVLLR